MLSIVDEITPEYHKNCSSVTLLKKYHCTDWLIKMGIDSPILNKWIRGTTGSAADYIYSVLGFLLSKKFFYSEIKDIARNNNRQCLITNIWLLSNLIIYCDIRV